ncbi:hypothetical protein Poli38472_012644 [Pythium oligandrum]|uniref:NmrA-like domain-containing protein n=1 Tax=Pythium oligandrum TaxID=41045 RepID=A0A8K1FK74_PYTOL|nr:hypothetical protein Poli38472_012644 [Pythium oligandrum]|eukprot:TMW61453.1 hypothetical protein Poli38472_012644 [Pythium oligandrum]
MAIQSRLLVTGASGQLGRATLRHLLETLKVDPQRIGPFFVDFNDRLSVADAAKDVQRALLTSSNDLFDRLEGQKATVNDLVKAGVQHIVYTSLQALDNAIAFIASDHRATEQAIKESNVPGYTFLRNGLYFENNVMLAAGAAKSGQWYSAAEDGKLAPIARDDLGRAAAYALAGETVDRSTYELTGSEAFTVNEMVAQISKAMEKPIQVVPVTVDQLAQGISAATGMPGFVAKALASMDANIAAGHTSVVTTDYEKLTGAKPQTHREWLDANKALLQSL